MDYDFSGYATKNDLMCSDGRIIRRDAFKDNDGTIVPLVWQHLHDEPSNVLGHAQLENREDGVYAYCSLNDSEQAKHAKILIQHGDINAMSIFANKLKQDGSNVLHGIIREVSLVLAGANPGAKIQNLSFAHSDGSEEMLNEEAFIYTDSLLNVEDSEYSMKRNASLQHAENDNKNADTEETVQDVIDSMTEKQRNVMYYIIGQALEDAGVDDEDQNDSDEGATMKHNLFSDTDVMDEDTLIHSEEVMAAFEDAPRIGSLRDSFVEHGIENIDVLFPEAQFVNPTPDMITRHNAWVSDVWNSVKKSPFSRIKSSAANLTVDDARAKGYVKGNKKLEEQFALLKRVTTPQTVYKLQKMDRDDVIDITDLDVVAWLKAEMRMMLDEELSRAVLVGDGRSTGGDDKIREENIRPIYQDADMYTIHYQVDIDGITDETDKSNAIIDAALRSRKDYRGTGNPTLYASVDVINDLLLAKDKLGRRLYSTVAELADALRVNRIVEVPIMEGVRRETDSKTFELLGLIVNLADYTVGADKGGAVSMFDDFDLNYNKYEYLIETRCSGALTKPYSAIALEKPVTSVEG